MEVTSRRDHRRRMLLVAGCVVGIVACTPSSTTKAARAMVPNPVAPAPPAAAVPAGVWSPRFVDEFDGTALDGRWSVYTGQPSSDRWTRWAADQVAIRHGALALSATPRPDAGGYWTSGGVSNWRDAQTYGRWAIRFRATPSAVQSLHFLLWPSANTWPPEVDIAESWSADRSKVDGFVHFTGTSGAQGRHNGSVTSDFRSWHTVSVEWTPSAIVYRLDGVEWFRVTGAAVPHQPMWLALQTETQICDRSRSACTSDPYGPPLVEVDRVVVERYAP